MIPPGVRQDRGKRFPDERRGERGWEGVDLSAGVLGLDDTSETGADRKEPTTAEGEAKLIK